MPKPFGRPLKLALAAVAGAAVAVAVVTSVPTSGTDRKDSAGVLDERMRELQIIPMTGRAQVFALPGLDGKRVALAELKGKAALLYFWATW
jgi:hypothetical protein